ncbi:MAG: DUF2088 domain-containing protein [Deltaproteobacteria bacterium]|nr:DUF2088 domain-containing protein [Deltaproteobacteria bacterium]
MDGADLLAAERADESPLDDGALRALVGQALERVPLDGERVLLIVPDSTRSGPVDRFFRIFHALCAGRVKALDVLVALGTHPPMEEQAIRALLGCGDEHADVGLFNHEWDRPERFRELGRIPAAEIEKLSGGLLARELSVRVNARLFDYDRLAICGPVFPHEVAGFSGGNKYFFPGVADAEIIDLTHWLGALITSRETIGRRCTPVRAVIDRAAALIDRPKLCFCMVVEGRDLHGLYAGTPEAAHAAAVELSAELHVIYAPRPFQSVLSVIPPMYDEIWTAAKGMYKLEPVVADGGEVILFAPHVGAFSRTHGQAIERVGYHVRDYFTAQWDRFRHEPWGVLAHSTHLRGQGAYAQGEERARIRVVLATGIDEARCRRVGLEYRDPAEIDPRAWQDREHEGRLLVLRAGEVLYRLEAER